MTVGRNCIQGGEMAERMRKKSHSMILSCQMISHVTEGEMNTCIQVILYHFTHLRASATPETLDVAIDSSQRIEIFSSDLAHGRVMITS